MNKNRIKFIATILIVICSTILLSACQSSYQEAGSQETTNIKEKIFMQLEDGYLIDDVVKDFEDSKITEIANGVYTIEFDSSEGWSEESLSSTKGIQKIGKTKKIGVVNPIKKIKVESDFFIDKLTDTIDIDTNDPGAKSQWAISYTNAHLIWNLVNQKQNVSVAIVDTGIDYNHPDLANRVNVKKGFDFVNNDKDAMDDNGHGTHVAGIIAAEANNETGIVGVVGKLNVEIIPVKVLNELGQGSSDDVALGIIHAVDQGADIINLSLGSSGDDQAIYYLIEYAISKGVLVIAASGNENTNCDNYIPAGIESVYTVGAINPIKSKASFSNYGDSIDLVAPGVKILSTVPGGGYKAWDGTSMAAPVVTGMAAILIAENPELSPNELKTILNGSTEDLAIMGEDIRTGHGLPDMEYAWERMTGEDLYTQSLTNSNISYVSIRTLLTYIDQVNIKDYEAMQGKIDMNNTLNVKDILEQMDIENPAELARIKKKLNEVDINEYLEAFRNNRRINVKHMKEIVGSIRELLPMLYEMAIAYENGTLEFTMEQMAFIQQQLQEFEDQRELVDGLMDDISQQWDDVLELLYNGELESAASEIPTVLKAQVVLAGYLETLLNQTDLLIEFMETDLAF